MRVKSLVRLHGSHFVLKKHILGCSFLDTVYFHMGLFNYLDGTFLFSLCPGLLIIRKGQRRLWEFWGISGRSHIYYCMFISIDE